MNISESIIDRLQDCWDQVTEDQVAQLEADLEVTFPADYREFLLEFNAGHWAHGVKCSVREPVWHLNEVGLINTLGIVQDERFSGDDIWWLADTLCGRMPYSLIPIMASPNPICIGTASDKYGRICVWNLDHEGCDENLVFEIADDFTQFLQYLIPDDYLETYTETLPVFQSVERGDKAEVGAYLTDGGKADCRNDKGWTLLSCAVRNRWPKIARMLLEFGADPNAFDIKGRPPIFHAIWAGSLDSLKLLIGAGADLNYRTPKGRDLAQLAKRYYHHRVQYFLEDLMR